MATGDMPGFSLDQPIIRSSTQYFKHVECNGQQFYGVRPARYAPPLSVTVRRRSENKLVTCLRNPL